MKKRIQDMDVKNKRVLLRCDFNVPVKDGKILDDSKIVAALFTIDYLVKQGAKIIIMSHFGKVKTEEDKVFWINLVETSKTYKHYKKSPISFYQDNGRDDTNVEDVLAFCKKREAGTFSILVSSNAIMEWLFTRTVHTGSLEVVSFSK